MREILGLEFALFGSSSVAHEVAAELRKK